MTRPRREPGLPDHFDPLPFQRLGRVLDRICDACFRYQVRGLARLPAGPCLLLYDTLADAVANMDHRRPHTRPEGVTP